MAISNIGPVDSVINKISVNGYQCTWNSSTCYVTYCMIKGSLPGELTCSSTYDFSPWTSTTIPLGDNLYDFNTANESIHVQTGYTLAFYVVINTSDTNSTNAIMAQDVSMPVNVILTTTQAVYCTEPIVEEVSQ